MITGLYADTSKDIESAPLDTINQNYAKPFKMLLENVPKNIVINKNKFTMRGIIAFSSPKRGNLRFKTAGHYTTYAYRSNDRWELYDDCKEKVLNVNKKCEVNVELIIFTI